ncbi:hypothetical protein BDV10DRAFT_138039 [Aspergillus recurvatus]
MHLWKVEPKLSAAASILCSCSLFWIFLKQDRVLVHVDHRGWTNQGLWCCLRWRIYGVLTLVSGLQPLDLTFLDRQVTPAAGANPCAVRSFETMPRGSSQTGSSA